MAGGTGWGKGIRPPRAGGTGFVEQGSGPRPVDLTKDWVWERVGFRDGALKDGEVWGKLALWSKF